MDKLTKKHDNTETGRKRTKQNFTNDGKFNTNKNQTRSDLADALYRREVTLVNKAKELQCD